MGMEKYNVGNIVNNIISVQTSVSLLVEHCPTKQNVASSIPCQGTCLGGSLVPCQYAYERQPINVSL